MRNLLLIFLALLLSNCHKFPASPCDDEDLRRKPEIVRIEPADTVNYDLALYLDYSYSANSNIILERKTKGGFERINYKRRSQNALLDTSFNKELDDSFFYRISVEKSGCRSDYSNEKAFDYDGKKFLYAPENLQAQIEFNGVRLTWRDSSNKEDGYRIERDEGSGYVPLPSQPRDKESYFDIIPGILSLPRLSYRIKAFNSNSSSRWAYTNTIEPNKGLIAYYPFNGNANDESGYGNHGTVIGATLTTNRFGNTDSAYAFNGVDNYIDYGTRPVLHFPAYSPFTLSGWVNSTKSYGAILSQRNSVDDGTVLNIHIGGLTLGEAPGKLMTIVRQDGSPANEARIIGGIVNDGKWHHFAVTRVASGLIELFLDGILQGSDAKSGSWGALTTDWRVFGTELAWLRRPARPDLPTMAWFAGSFDDVRIYNRALPEAQIKALYCENGWCK